METYIPVHTAPADLPGIFDQLRRHLFSTLEAIPAEDFNRAPAQGGWSAGQVTQHLVLSAKSALDALGSPAVTTDRDPARQMPLIRDIFMDYDQKFPTAPILEPGDGPFEKTVQLQRLSAALDQLTGALQRPGLEAEHTAITLPVFGTLTGLEWLCLAGAHSTRHVHQLQEITAGL